MPTGYSIQVEHHGPFLVLDSRTLGEGRYVLCNRDGTEVEEAVPPGSDPETTPSLVTVFAVGGGSQGVVVRAKEILRDVRQKEPPVTLPRAIKLERREDESSDGDHFTQEVQAAAAAADRPFRNLIPLLDCAEGLETRSKQSYRYLVWQYVDGVTLGAFFFKFLAPKFGAILENNRRQRRAHDILLTLIGDVLAGLTELHERGLAHIDLKPTNVIVYPPVPAGSDLDSQLALEYRAFVIDLGAVKPIGKRAKPVARRIHVLHTKPYFPDFLGADLGYEAATRTFDSAAIGRFGTRIDLSCFGRSLESLLLDRSHMPDTWPDLDPTLVAREPEKEAFWREVLGDDFGVIAGTVRRLIGRPPEPPFKDAMEVKRRVMTIPLKSAKGILDADTLTDRFSGIRIRVGRTLIKVASPFDAVVDHPAFQRLRNLHQLGLIAGIFPDATHSRFAHSLRTFHLAKQFVSGLGRKSEFRLIFDRADVEQLLAAALLHDIGQYPFSHSLEDLRKIGDRVRERRLNGQDDENADYLTAISHDQERFPDLIRLVGPNGMTIEKILESQELNVSEIVYLVQKRERRREVRPALNIARDVVNGVIDVDRVSYLVHDSERTGVPYGAGVDVGGLIEGLTVRNDDKEVGLGVEAGAAGAAETVLMATYGMYRHVYWRHTNRALMAALKFVTRRLLWENHQSQGKKGLSFDTYLRTAESETRALRLLRIAYDRLRLGGTNPLESVQQGGRIGYRRVYSLGWEKSEQGHQYDRIVWGVAPMREDALLAEIGRSIPGNPALGDILIDVPLKRRLFHKKDGDDVETKGEGARPANVWVRRRWHLTREVQTPAWVELRRFSPLAGVFGQVEDHSGRKIRVFFSRQLLSRIGRSYWNDMEKMVLDRLLEGTKDWPEPPASQDAS